MTENKITPIINSKFKENRKLCSIKLNDDGIFTNICEICALKPYEYFYPPQRRNKESILYYDHWFDDFGNSLMVDTYNEPQIIYNDLSLKKRRLIPNSDLYYGLEIKDIVKISNQVLFLAGKDEDLKKPIYFISLLGMDNHLRTFIYLYGKWERISNLVLGYEYLSIFSDKVVIPYENLQFKKFNWECGFPCQLDYCVLLYLKPMKKEYENFLETNYQEVYEQLINNKEKEIG